MTHTAAFPEPSFSLPAENDLDTVVNDVTALWFVAKTRQLDAEATLVFRQNPSARTNVDAARVVQRALRALLNFSTEAEASESPFALEDPVQPFELRAASLSEAPVQDEGQVPPTQTEDAAPVEADPHPVPGADSVAAERTQLEPEARVQTEDKAPHEEVTVWSPDLLGQGLISGLAHTLAVGDSVQLVLTRTAKGELRAVLLPQRLKGELAATCLSLTAKGTPRELDQDLLQAMSSYQGSRKTARELAGELLAATQQAAEAARAAAQKTAEQSKQKAQQAAQQAAERNKASLTVKVNVQGAAVSVTNGNTTHSPIPGAVLKVDAGKYTVRVEAEGHQAAEEAITLKAKDSKVLELKLEPVRQTLLF